MRYEYKGRNIEISDKLKEMSEKKLERLSKFFSPATKQYGRRGNHHSGAGIVSDPGGSQGYG